VTKHGDGTRVVRAGLPEAEQGTPFLPGPVLAAPFHLEGEVDTAPWMYTRYGNPTWERYEAALAEAARDAGALSVVDNTTAGPLSQKVLDLGADFALTSATKHLSGHADLMLGYVAARGAERARALRDWRRDAGAIPGPFETWLAHRSLPTLALRMERASANALALAETLSAREDVTGVRYPGLRGDVAHEIARRQMSGFGSVIGFDLASRERAERFLATAELVTEATSFGSVHTTAERRLRWGGDDVPEGYIRLSAGCEETADLVADVERALDGA
jgi:cystathionine gamma-lyase